MGSLRYSYFACAGYKCKERRRQKNAPSLWVHDGEGWRCPRCQLAKPARRCAPSEDLEYEYGLVNILGEVPEGGTYLPPACQWIRKY